MRTKKAALGFAPREAARDSNPPTPRRIHESETRSNSTRRPRRPFPNRSLRVLARHELLGTYLDLEGALVSLTDARARRAALLLAGEEIPNQDEERRVWNDRPRGAA